MNLTDLFKQQLNINKNAKAQKTFIENVFGIVS